MYSDNTKKAVLVALVFLFVLSVVTPFVPTASATVYPYTFHGPYNENTGSLLMNRDGDPVNCTVSVHYSTSVVPDLFNITSIPGSENYIFNATEQPQYFSYEVVDDTGGLSTTYHREYWLNPTETSGTYYVFFAPSENTYTISFLDYVGMLKTYPYIIAQLATGANTLTVEKRIIDAQGIVSMDLAEGRTYRILYGDGTTWNTYGNLTTTSTLGIQLVLRGVDFPESTLHLYQYVHTDAIRDFLNPIGAITVAYEDTTLMTTNVLLEITNTTDNTIAFSNLFTSQNFSYTWAYADNATDYQVTITINHLTYGTFYYKQYLLGEYTKPSEPFSLSFLGTGLPISTAALIPALILVFVAGCFSEANAEIAGVIVGVVAILLTALGWIPIDQGAIIAVLSFSIMGGVVAVRRRYG